MTINPLPLNASNHVLLQNISQVVYFNYICSSRLRLKLIQGHFKEILKTQRHWRHRMKQDLNSHDYFILILNLKNSIEPTNNSLIPGEGINYRSIVTCAYSSSFFSEQMSCKILLMVILCILVELPTYEGQSAWEGIDPNRIPNLFDLVVQGVAYYPVNISNTSGFPLDLEFGQMQVSI